MAVINIRKGVHVGEVIQKAFAEFKHKEMEPTTYNWLCDWCENILVQAIEYRKNPAVMGGNGEVQSGHNFTGNLINSICVVLYQKSTGKKTKFFASQTGLKPAIRREISGLSFRGKQRAYRVHFRPGSRIADVDWSGAHSHLNPESLIPTDESYGRMDAIQFANSWAPSTKCDFEIVVAYTSEYAKWVEMRNGTTGILETMVYADRTAVAFVGLKKVT